MSPVFVPGAQEIGIATLGGAATTIGPIAIPPGYGFLCVGIYIAGYSASQIAQIRLGAAATVDTGTNYSSFSNSFTTAAVSGASSASATGVRVSNVAQTNARRCMALIHNPAGQNKIVSIQTVDYSGQSPTAATAMANGAQVNGAWFNTAQALSIALDSGGGGSLNSGSYLAVYGIPGTA